mgnify:CR=1 FL=1
MKGLHVTRVYLLKMFSVGKLDLFDAKILQARVRSSWKHVSIGDVKIGSETNYKLIKTCLAKCRRVSVRITLKQLLLFVKRVVF